MSLYQQIFDMVSGVDRFVMVTVIEVTGSAPREVGARMVVTEESSKGSIGGGNLEFHAIRSARDLLSDKSEFLRKTEFFGLGVMMQQCCGGAVQLMYEKFSGGQARQLIKEFGAKHAEYPRLLISPVSDDRPAFVASGKSDISHTSGHLWNRVQEMVADDENSNRIFADGSQQWFVTRLDEFPTRIVLFGAGHVGKALVKLLQDLPFQVDWVDQRPEMFPSEIPANTRTISSADPVQLIEQQLPGVFFVVMTHDHGLDYKLCLRILKRQSFGWLGLIGSATKRKRFEQRLIKDGIDPFRLKRLVCPIGISGIRGKTPAVIAMSTAAQLLEKRDRVLSGQSEKSPVRADARL